MSLGNRQQHINKFTEKQQFDLIVVGGGISGAGIALDAASRGLSVLLLEENDFASGSSSKSSKAILSSLFYLKSLKFIKAISSKIEEQILYKNAMFLLYPQKVILPVSKKQSGSYLLISIFLQLFRIFSHKVIARRLKNRLLTQKAPLLDTKHFSKAFEFNQYKINDSRLVITLLKTAAKNNATILNYCPVTGLILNAGLAEGVSFTDTLNKQTYRAYSKHIITSTGIFGNKFLHPNYKTQTPNVTHKSCFASFDANKLPIKQAFSFNIDSTTDLFVCPKENMVYAGISKSLHLGTQIAEYDAEAQNLIHLLTNAFKGVSLTQSDIIAKWAELSPVSLKPQAQDNYKVSTLPSGIMVTPYCRFGKYRLLAKKTVDEIQRIRIKNGFPDIGKCKTDRLKLMGLPESIQTEADLIEYADSRFDEAKHVSISRHDFKLLFYRYGSEVAEITERAFDHYNNNRNPQQAWLKAELDYLIEHEMLIKPSDFFEHRTELAYFYPNKVNYKFVASYLTDSDLA